MELFTLDRNFLRQDTLDTFHSAIWTERYYGDGEAELVVPITTEMVQKLKEGTFLGLVGSTEIIIIEKQELEEGKLKVTGNSLMKFLNNRFVRVSAAHADRYWPIDGPPGWILWAIIYYMCVPGSPFLVPGAPTGIPNPQTLAIPNLWLASYDTTLSQPVHVAVPYGPVYDGMREVATTFQIGMSLYLESADENGYALRFRNYRGLDRTSAQTVNTQVRFSPEMDSLTDIKELRTIENFKTQVHTFAPANPGDLATTAGLAQYISGVSYTGFDLRALMTFAEDITTDMINGDANVLLQILNTRAQDALTNHHFVKVVDGEIVPTAQFKYGRDYNLGDIVELQGNSGIVQNARVTEYIRSQDESGEHAYPTVAVLD